MMAAHFLRGGNLILVALTVALPLLLLARRSWAVRAVQTAMLGGAIMWFATAVNIGETRRAVGAPSTRMFLILGVVAVFTAFAALPLEAAVSKLRHIDG